MAGPQKFLIVRRDDLLILGVGWTGFDLQSGAGTGGPARLVATASPGTIVLTFPPQSIAEEKLTEGPFQLRRARLAGSSTVEFAVAAGTQIDLTAEGLLDALLTAGHVVVSSAGEPDGFTAIELPWGLVVAATARSGSASLVWEHSPRAVLSPVGMSGLWSARLSASNGSATDAELALLPLQVKPDPEDPTLNFAPLDAGDRQRILTESASQLAQLKRFELSALGGSFVARAVWPTFEWDHETALGRDQKVRLLSKGVLYPFGHRAELQQLTERIMQPAGQSASSDPQSFAIAGLRKELVLVITEPIRRAVADERLAREFPFAEVEILTRSFRDIIEPSNQTENPWDWDIYKRPPFAPDAIQIAIDDVDLELGTLTTDVNERLAALPQNFQQMLDQGFPSAFNLQAAQDALAQLDPEGLQRAQREIDDAIDRLQASFQPLTIPGPDGEPIDNPGAAEANAEIQRQIEELIATRPSNQTIQEAFQQQAVLLSQLPGLEAAAQADFDQLPRTIEQFAEKGDENAKRILMLREQRPQLVQALDEFNAAKQERHKLFFTPHTSDKKLLQFPVRCLNAEGNIYFSLPLIFVNDLEFDQDNNFPAFDALTDGDVATRLDAAWGSRNAVALPGVRLNPLQRAPVAPPKPADIQEVHQITIGGNPHGGTFRPSLSEFLVDLPTLRTLLPDQPERIALKLRDDFLNFGESVDIALAPVKPIGIDFTERPDRSGGLISPRYAADVISRELGPVARKALPDINVPVPDLSSIYDGATLLGFPLAKLIKTDGPEGLPKPPRIVPVMENGLPSGARMEWNDIKLKNHEVFRVTEATKFKLSVESSRAKTETTCSVSDFSLVLPPTGTELLAVSFKSVVFTQQAGHPPDLQVNGLELDFRGALKLLKKIQDELMPLIGIAGPKPSVDVTKSGITAKYALTLPSVPAGAFLLKNIAILISLEVPFTKKPVTISLGFARRDNPFALTVLMFGGGGYIDVQVGGSGINRLEASLEFGAMIDIDLVVARGEVHALGGLHFLKSPDGSLNFEGYIRIGGSVEVLGLVSVSVELVVMLTYESEPNRLVGRATLVIEVDVTFFSDSITLDSGEYVLAGSETTPVAAPAGPALFDETAGDAGLALWRQTRRAFAEA